MFFCARMRDYRSMRYAMRNHLGMPSMQMLSGGNGIHVILRLHSRAERETVKLFSQTVPVVMAGATSNRSVATMSKAKRKGLIFIDRLQNECGGTKIAPYAHCPLCHARAIPRGRLFGTASTDRTSV